MVGLACAQSLKQETIIDLYMASDTGEFAPVSVSELSVSPSFFCVVLKPNPIHLPQGLDDP